MVVVSSRSSGGMIWSAISTTTTCTPRSCRFSAISSPMYPAPITTACVIGGRPDAPRPSTAALMTSMSPIRRSTWMSGWSTPGSGGVTGDAPGHSASES